MTEKRLLLPSVAGTLNHVLPIGYAAQASPFGNIDDNAFGGSNKLIDYGVALIPSRAELDQTGRAGQSSIIDL